MRVTAGKSTLRNNIQVHVPQRVTMIKTAIVLDLSVVSWICGLCKESVPLPYKDSRYGFFCSCLDICLCFTKSSIISTRAIHSRFHYITLATQLPTRDKVLKSYTNKSWLNELFSQQVLSDNDFLRSSIQVHKLVVTPKRLKKKKPCMGISH